MTVRELAKESAESVLRQALNAMRAEDGEKGWWPFQRLLRTNERPVSGHKRG